MNFNKLLKKWRYKYEDLNYIVSSYMSNQLSDEDMTLFLKRVCKKGLSVKETIYLTDIYIKSGTIVDLSRVTKPTVDKHSTGGIGDKVSLIVAPLVASLDIAVPKMSGRSLGYTGGTIDKLESIDGYRVELSEEEFINELNTVGMSIISQTQNITPADKKIYALRDITGTVESIPLIAASIMSKKIACGTNFIVIDLKVGAGAFMKNKREASKLVKYMKKIALHYNKKLTCVLTRMDSPLGNTIGNALEVKEALEFFEGKWEKDLGAVVLTIATEMVALAKKITEAQAIALIKENIANGKAKNKFYEWIAYQGGNINTIDKPHKKLLIKTQNIGYIKNIDALKLGILARDLGAGRVNKDDLIDYAAGIVLLKNVGSNVIENNILAEVYYNKEIPNIESRVLDAFEIVENPVKEKDSIIMIL